jgi:hypothetical protein
MKMQQSMSGQAVQKKIDVQAQKFANRFNSGTWTLNHAHSVLQDADKHELDLFQIAGLAKAIACFQCSEK